VFKRGLQRGVGLRVNLMLFVVTVGSILVAIVFNSREAARFNATAMRFVPAEAVSFAVVPNLQTFMTNGSSSFLAIVSNIASRKSEADFISLLMPAPKLNDLALPAQCRSLRNLADLQQSGLEPDGSFSIARLDSGSRVAIQVKDEARALTFLADVLFPAYVRVSVPVSGNANDPEVGRTFSNVDEVDALPNNKFSLSIVAENADLCLDADRQSPQSGIVRKDFKIAPDTLYIPVRVVDTQTTGPRSTATLDVTCSVAPESTDKPPMPCDCALIQLGIGEGAPSAIPGVGCSMSASLNDRAEKVRSWLSSISSGKTIAIGNHFLRKIGSFFVVEQLTVPSTPRSYQILVSGSSLIRDDSVLRQFQKILDDGHQFSSTLFGGARPDWIVDYGGASLRGFPLYLMTPIGVHFRDQEVFVDAVTNLQPQDMAIIQTIAARDKLAFSSGGGWNASGAGLGAKLADRSLKMYGAFMRAYFPNADQNLAKYAPLGPVAVDIMEEDASTVVLSMNDLSDDGKSARVTLAVPDISPEYAGRLVSKVQRQLVLRQARLTVEAGGRMALQEGVDADKLLAAIPRFICPPRYWELKSLIRRKSDDVDDPETATFRSSIQTNNDDLLADSRNWSALQGDVRLRRLLPFEDANAALWGDAFSGGRGFAQLSQEKIDNDVSGFLDGLAKTGIAVKNATSGFKETLNYKGEELLEAALSMEASRAGIKNLRVSDSIRQIMQAETSDAALQALAAFQGAMGKNLKESALLTEDDIGTFCETGDKKVGSSPVAFYDARLKTLYFLDSAEQMKGSPQTTLPADSAGKLVVSLTTPNLADLLKKGNLNADRVDQLRRFPFAVVQLTLAGRESGAGVEVRLSMKKGESGDERVHH
jgi:hypothetical protein